MLGVVSSGTGWHNEWDVNSVYSFNDIGGHNANLSVRWQRTCSDELGQVLP